MDWQKPTSSDEGIKIPDNWLFLHYYEALSILFKVENSLRTLVYVVLKNEHGTKWVDIDISSDEASKTTIGALAKKRIAQIESYGYLGYQVACPIMHLTSGELVRLLTSEPCWPLFKRFFKAKKEVVILKLEEIGTIRNSLAHFRPLTGDDIEVVKQNANQVLALIEATLASVIAEGQRVPTNTTDQWYVTLYGIAGKHSKMVYNQSLDAEWVRVSLHFSCPILSVTPSKPDKWVVYSVLNVNPVEMLRRHGPLREAVTCVLEATPFVLMPPDFKPPFAKHINFVFHRRRLEKDHGILKAAFDELLAQIDKEADLILEDNLAKGDFVYASSIQGNKNTYENFEFWRFNDEQLHWPLRADDPPEFWGVIQVFSANVVSDAHRFPWMPVAVSNLRLTF